MARHRIPRLNEQLKREITSIVRDEVRDPRVGLVTVTGVEVSKDLSVARVYVRSAEGREAQAASVEGLQAAATFIRGEVGRRLHIRKSPELRFELDRSLDHARRIEQLLDQVRADDRTAKQGDDAPDPDA